MNSELFEVRKLVLTKSLSCVLGKSEWLLIASLKGVLDGYSEPILTSLIDQHLGKARANVIIDLTHVSFVDLEGLLFLQQLHMSCRDESAKLVLIVPENSSFQKILSLAKLSNYFLMYEDIFSGIESFRSTFEAIYSNEWEVSFESQISHLIAQKKRKSYSQTSTRKAYAKNFNGKPEMTESIGFRSKNEKRNNGCQRGEETEGSRRVFVLCLASLCTLSTIYFVVIVS